MQKCLQRGRVHVLGLSDRATAGSAAIRGKGWEGVEQQARVETVHAGGFIAHTWHEKLAGLDGCGDDVVFLKTSSTLFSVERPPSSATM